MSHSKTVAPNRPARSVRLTLPAKFMSAVCHPLPGPGQGESDNPQPLRSRKPCALCAMQEAFPHPLSEHHPPKKCHHGDIWGVHGGHTGNTVVSCMGLSTSVLIANICPLLSEPHIPQAARAATPNLQMRKLGFTEAFIQGHFRVILSELELGASDSKRSSVSGGKQAVAQG